MIIYYLPVPDTIAMPYIVGRQGSTLRLLLSEDKEDKDTFCWPCLERGKKVHPYCYHVLSVNIFTGDKTCIVFSAQNRRGH